MQEKNDCQTKILYTTKISLNMRYYFKQVNKSKRIHQQETQKGNINRCPSGRTLISNIKLNFLPKWGLQWYVCFMIIHWYVHLWYINPSMYPWHIIKNLIKWLLMYTWVCLYFISLHFFSIKRHQVGSESFIGCSYHPPMNNYSLFLTDFSRERKNEKAATLFNDTCTDLIFKLEKESIKTWKM